MQHLMVIVMKPLAVMLTEQEVKIGSGAVCSASGLTVFKQIIVRMQKVFR